MQNGKSNWLVAALVLMFSIRVRCSIFVCGGRRRQAGKIRRGRDLCATERRVYADLGGV